MLSSSLPEQRISVHSDGENNLLNGVEVERNLWRLLQNKLSPHNNTTSVMNQVTYNSVEGGQTNIPNVSEEASTALSYATLANLLFSTQHHPFPLLCGGSNSVQSLIGSSYLQNHYNQLWTQLSLVGAHSAGLSPDNVGAYPAALASLHEQIAKSTAAAAVVGGHPLNMPFSWIAAANSFSSSSPLSSDFSVSSSYARTSPSISNSHKGESNYQCPSTSPMFYSPHQVPQNHNYLKPNDPKPRRKSSLSILPATKENSHSASEPIAVPYANKRVSEESEVYWRQRKVLVIQTQDVEEHFRNSLLKSSYNKASSETLASSNCSFSQHVTDPVEQHFLSSLKEDFSHFRLTSPHKAAQECHPKDAPHPQSPSESFPEEFTMSAHFSCSNSNLDQESLPITSDTSTDSHKVTTSCRSENFQSHKPKYKWSVRYQQDSSFHRNSHDPCSLTTSPAMLKTLSDGTLVGGEAKKV